MTEENNNANGANPFEPGLGWDRFSPALLERLKQPLDRNLVSQRQGSGRRMFDYIEGSKVIDQANDIFGYDGWGYEVKEVRYETFDIVNQQTAEIIKQASYCAIVQATVVGAPPRTDIGDCDVTSNTPDGRETARKGAVTDGLKRALRSFGAQFGNSLYSDDPVDQNRSNRGQANNGNNAPANATPNNAPAAAPPPQASNHAALQKRLLELSQQQGHDEQMVRKIVDKKTGATLENLPLDQLQEFVDAAAAKVVAQQSQQPVAH